MVLFLANLVAIVVVGAFVWRRGRDRRIEGARLARRLRRAGLVPLGLQVAILLLFGIGEMAAGDTSGAGHLPEALVVVLLAAVAWLRPLEGGIALLASGILFTISVLISVAPPQAARIISALGILAAPQIISGALFSMAGLVARRAGETDSDQKPEL